ncbi:MAG: valine--tRNA ligase [Dehalococcoidia bacterium]|nr:valine--tRNA ligase [Dehalococcoidia bacterium]
MEREKLARAYEPGRIEKKWYDFWLSHGYFRPKVDPTLSPYVITMPPPNVTGELHVGHALTMALEDIMIRWHRLLGEPTLWVPGSDHAGIATQVLVEQDLAREGLTRNDIGRDKFVERAWTRAQRSRSAIRQQLQLIGCSCDWERDTFTLDEGPSRAVRAAFVRLYEKGRVYRGERMVNWCPRCRTALSDLEVEHQDTDGRLYYFRYPFVDGTGFLTIATTRPETYFGDTAVAVSPLDQRYSSAVGKRVRLPGTGREIPVIADEAVDPSFGTGALKITPSHDPTDLLVADRHNLPHINVIDKDGTMNAEAGACKGLDRMACRERVVEEFTRQGLLDHIEPYSHMVGHCSRCRTAVEPSISLQWFVDTKPLAEAAIAAVRSGEIRIIPEHFTKVYYSWMESIKDWCISRQLWWGHRIPVWYCADCRALTVAVETPSVCSKCGSSHIEQDPDVLDTWFSSGLWPHSTLGWPADTADMRYFYPTTMMETGYDILFFWVARMIMMGIEDTGKVPFKFVYLNGLIRDEQGQKMSKMRGNVIRPDDAISKYGVDALRYALTTGNSPGNDLSLGDAKLEAGRNFVNKLWNATRFVLQSAEQWRSNADSGSPLPTPNRIEDRWILSRLNRLTASVRSLMAEYQLGEAERQIQDFLWSEFCDWYIELAKLRMRRSASDATPAGDAVSDSPAPYLASVLDAALRLLHPFMPFVTEELWQTMQPEADDAVPARSIMVAPCPEVHPEREDVEAEHVVGAAIDIVRALRNARAERRVEAQSWIEASIYTGGAILEKLQPLAPAVESLARTHILRLADRDARGDSAESQRAIVLADAEIVVARISPEEALRVRTQLEKEAEVTRTRLLSVTGRLEDAAFVAKAPADVTARQRELAINLHDKLERLEAELRDLG